MRDRFQSIIQSHVPAQSINYCTDLWEKVYFNFKVTRHRTSKLGDYRYNKANKIHTITVNGNLNPYSFLITYIHEVAHLQVQLAFGNRVLPHGREWKAEFKKLMIPMMTPAVFPDDLLKGLARHMKNPKASSLTDHNLVKILREYDAKSNDGMVLAKIENGGQFIFSERHFKKIETRRTRALCLELKTGKKYLIAETAYIKKV